MAPLALLMLSESSTACTAPLALLCFCDVRAAPDGSLASAWLCVCDVRSLLWRCFALAM